MQRRIVVIGAGYVGLTAGVCFASFGHKVVCVDRDKTRIKQLKKGIAPFYEPKLNEFLKRYSNNLELTGDLSKAMESGEVIFVCVGTFSQKDGSIDTKDFKRIIRQIGKQLKSYKIIVIKSTVPVGSGEWAEKEIQKHYKGDFSIFSNPEFLREGAAIKDFLKPDRIVIGTEDKKAKKVLLDIYSSINAPKLITDIKNAELIKYASNAFLAAKISFINEIANICEKIGGDVKKVAEGIGLDKRIGKDFLKAGIGYGGSCFSKDIDSLIKISKKKKYNFKILKAVAWVNQNQQIKFAKKIQDILKKINGNTVGIWGLAFKPNTDDIRKSPAIEVIKKLQGAGCKIKAYDPAAMKNAKKELSSQNIEFAKSPLEAVQKADILVLITDWPRFLQIDTKKVKKLMRRPYILDGRNQFEPEKLKKIGFFYEGVGRK